MVGASTATRQSGATGPSSAMAEDARSAASTSPSCIAGCGTPPRSLASAPGLDACASCIAAACWAVTSTSTSATTLCPRWRAGDMSPRTCARSASRAIRPRQPRWRLVGRSNVESRSNPRPTPGSPVTNDLRDERERRILRRLDLSPCDIHDLAFEAKRADDGATELSTQLDLNSLIERGIVELHRDRYRIAEEQIPPSLAHRCAGGGAQPKRGVKRSARARC